MMCCLRHCSNWRKSRGESDNCLTGRWILPVIRKRLAMQESSFALLPEHDMSFEEPNNAHLLSNEWLGTFVEQGDACLITV